MNHDGVWTVCPKCGGLIADSTKHDEWHAALAGAEDGVPDGGE